MEKPAADYVLGEWEKNARQFEGTNVHFNSIPPHFQHKNSPTTSPIDG
jgi:hypothetical protein